jgi:hypothetical protein
VNDTEDVDNQTKTAACAEGGDEFKATSNHAPKATQHSMTQHQRSTTSALQRPERPAELPVSNCKLASFVAAVPSQLVPYLTTPL